MYYKGKQITTIEEWENNRKEELKNLALENIYGFIPEPPQWDYKIIKEVFLKEQNVYYKEIVIQLYKDNLPTREIRLSIFIPETQSGKSVPVVLAINKCGNPTVSSISEVGIYHDRILHPKCKKEMKKRGGTLESLRGLQNDYWALDTLFKRGYAFATFHDSDIGADTNSLEQGIFPFYPELKNETGWKLISAWAWGLQRAVDYLVTDKQIDSTRIILFGHSRRGKAALLAAALDERVVMVIPHQSGTGGMALSKKYPMETVRRINKTFPFWFNDKFKTYGKHPKELPLDQHYLLALMAPRPVIETVGTWDVWSSFRLSLKTLNLVAPVYELYGKPGLVGKGKISNRKNLTKEKTGQLVQVRRPYKHTMNVDYWNYILDFADLKLCDCE
jgi:hypothetical protein